MGTVDNGNLSWVIISLKVSELQLNIEIMQSNI